MVVYAPICAIDASISAVAESHKAFWPLDFRWHEAWQNKAIVGLLAGY